MNSLDRKLASILNVLTTSAADGARWRTASSDFREIQMRLGDPRLGKAWEEFFRIVSLAPEKRPTLLPGGVAEIVGDLRDRGLARSAASVFSTLHSLPLERALELAPNAASVEGWRKWAGIGTHEFEEQLLSLLPAAYATAGADWLLLRGRLEKLDPLFELFLSRQPRPRHLAGWADALAGVLKKDKRGAFLSALLRRATAGDDCLLAVAETVRLNRDVLTIAAEALPLILARKEVATWVMPFIRQVFDGVIVSEGPEREFLTALLARLGTGIVLVARRGPQTGAALEFIEGTTRQLRNLTRDDSERGRTWVFESLHRGHEGSDERVHMSIEGARHLALAFEKAAQGFSAYEILSATAQNVGLTPVGKKGEVLRYDPLRHEDVEGGMLPGDLARVEEPGWSCRNDVVMRAKVRKT